MKEPLEISINSFAKHDQNLLFFFNYECFVGSKMVLRMDSGCAGFFSDEDLAQGRGVLHTAQELELKQNAEKIFFPALLNCQKTSFSRQELLEISNGNPAGCFGPEYNQHGLSNEEQKQLIALSRDSLLEEVPINRFTSFIGNIMATRISSLWDFSGPAMTISSGENSVFRALEIAQMLLTEDNVDAVVINAVDLAGSPEKVLLHQRNSPLNSAKATLSFGREVNGWMIGEGAGTVVVLKSMKNAKKDGEQIFATLEAVAFANGISADSVEDAGREALKLAKIKPQEVGLLEVFASGNELEDKAEMSGLRMVSPELKKMFEERNVEVISVESGTRVFVGYLSNSVQKMS